MFRAALLAIPTALLIPAAVVGAVLLVVLGTVVWQAFEGPLISQHAQNQFHSSGFVSAKNSRCRDDITEYNTAKHQYDVDAGNAAAQSDDSSHMNALVLDCRGEVGQLYPNEISPDVQQFLSAHQGG